ncbi:DUF2182 domain-containing protein [Limimaricola pyoseonensis]|uniref:Predicted metal-binding membrane protein n=1 Tax=Limimaricola pyoseonensis TaxID=521013 RepID=A0A1G7KZ83_9RHOB|nr:DUF2182 domain-containing protein [Limimaricola pyoseonensis]SDF42582.1 Predicted metal-binding membrane protein [Limimaricola pyoseonensis]
MAETAPDPVAELLRHERALCLALLAALTGLAWAYTLAGPGMPASAPAMTPGLGDGMARMTMAGHGWSAGHAAMMLAMWWVMMAAMMLPSAAPVVLLAAALNRRATGAAPFAGAAVFVAGYLLAWLGFSLAATAAQWGLAASGLLGPGMASASTVLTGAMLLGAGLWQFTPAKRACLRHCRSPVDWLLRHRARGVRGALLTGLGHGGYCLGCCWALMVLLFAGGVMNLWWIAGLALVVLAEKLAPRGPGFGRWLGAGLVAAGLAVLLAAARGY